MTAEAAPALTDADALVQEALESMLSKKNLVRDQFLAGKMNPQMYIPITVLLAHEKLQSINAQESSVIAAATRSARLGIDDQKKMVRPLLKSKRNVVILRDIPDDVKESEIRELFVGAPHADVIENIKPEVNGTWFVKFKLDDGTQDVVLWLRSQQLRGKPVNAAIKSEHFLRSFFPMQMPPGGQVPDGGMSMPGMPPVPYPVPVQGMPMEQQEMPQGMPGGCGGMMPPMPMEAMVMPPPMAMEAFGKGKEAFGKGMMKGGMPMPPPMTLQLPGYWQPWGTRMQPPPLIFTTSTGTQPQPEADQDATDRVETGDENSKGKAQKGKPNKEKSSKGKGDPKKN